MYAYNDVAHVHIHKLAICVCMCAAKLKKIALQYMLATHVPEWLYASICICTNNNSAKILIVCNNNNNNNATYSTTKKSKKDYTARETNKSEAAMLHEGFGHFRKKKNCKKITSRK